MNRRAAPRRAPLLVLGVLAVCAVLAAIAIPVLAASPAPSGTPGTPAKAPKASEAPEVTVTLHGVVAAAKGAGGETTYTMTVDGATVLLDAGPPWFFGATYPLAAYVGKTVTITGSRSGNDVEVETVDGVQLRAPGKPPWAGGWKAVGSIHPGWSQAKADRQAQKRAAKNGAAGAAGCWPPGQCKSHEPDGPDASESPEPS
jgi:hypothetical protein